MKNTILDQISAIQTRLEKNRIEAKLLESEINQLNEQLQTMKADETFDKQFAYNLKSIEMRHARIRQVLEYEDFEDYIIYLMNIESCVNHFETTQVIYPIPKLLARYKELSKQELEKELVCELQAIEAFIDILEDNTPEEYLVGGFEGRNHFLASEEFDLSCSKMALEKISLILVELGIDYKKQNSIIREWKQLNNY